MVAKDAAESDDSETRDRLLDELVDVEHVERTTGSCRDEWVNAVFCVWCKTRYPHGMGPTQATDCASVVYERDGEWFAVGCYGSRAHDMSLYRFVQNAPAERADPVCDACLNVRLAGGDMVLVDEVAL